LAEEKRKSYINLSFSEISRENSGRKNCGMSALNKYGQGRKMLHSRRLCLTKYLFIKNGVQIFASAWLLTLSKR
jgi:hypothetical protein